MKSNPNFRLSVTFSSINRIGKHFTFSLCLNTNSTIRPHRTCSREKITPHKKMINNPIKAGFFSNILKLHFFRRLNESENYSCRKSIGSENNVWIDCSMFQWNNRYHLAGWSKSAEVSCTLQMVGDTNFRWILLKVSYNWMPMPHWQLTHIRNGYVSTHSNTFFVRFVRKIEDDFLIESKMLTVNNSPFLE